MHSLGPQETNQGTGEEQVASGCSVANFVRLRPGECSCRLTPPAATPLCRPDTAVPGEGRSCWQVFIGAGLKGRATEPRN